MFGFRTPCDGTFLEILSQQHDLEEEGKKLNYEKEKQAVKRHTWSKDGWKKKGGKKKSRAGSARQLELFGTGRC